MLRFCLNSQNNHSFLFNGATTVTAITQNPLTPILKEKKNVCKGILRP